MQEVQESYRRVIHRRHIGRKCFSKVFWRTGIPEDALEGFDGGC